MTLTTKSHSKPVMIYSIEIYNEDSGEVNFGLFSSEEKAQKWFKTFDPATHTAIGVIEILDAPGYSEATIH